MVETRLTHPSGEQCVITYDPTKERVGVRTTKDGDWKGTRTSYKKDATQADYMEAISAKQKEGYVLESRESNTTDMPGSDDPGGSGGSGITFPVVGTMLLPNADTCYLIGCLDNRYQFKVEAPIEHYETAKLGASVRIRYESTDSTGAPVDPVFIEVVTS